MATTIPGGYGSADEGSVNTSRKEQHTVYEEHKGQERPAIPILIESNDETFIIHLVVTTGLTKVEWKGTGTPPANLAALSDEDMAKFIASAVEIGKGIRDQMRRNDGRVMRALLRGAAVPPEHIPKRGTQTQTSGEERPALTRASTVVARGRGGIAGSARFSTASLTSGDESSRYQLSLHPGTVTSGSELEGSGGSGKSKRRGLLARMRGGSGGASALARPEGPETPPALPFEQKAPLVRGLIMWLGKFGQLGEEGLYRLASDEAVIGDLEVKLRGQASQLTGSSVDHKVVKTYVMGLLENERSENATILAANLVKRFLREGDALISSDEWEIRKGSVPGYNPDNPMHVTQAWQAVYAGLESSRKILFGELHAHLKAVDAAQTGRDDNKMDADQLGNMFGPALFQERSAVPQASSAGDLANAQAAATMMMTRGGLVTILIRSDLEPSADAAADAGAAKSESE